MTVNIRMNDRKLTLRLNLLRNSLEIHKYIRNWIFLEVYIAQFVILMKLIGGIILNFFIFLITMPINATD